MVNRINCCIAAFFGFFGIQIFTFREKFNFPFERYLNFINENFQNDLVKLGGSGDGSYVVTKSLENCNVLLSPGIGKSIFFDLEIAARGLKVFMTDGTVSTFPPIPPRLKDSFDLQNLNISRYESLGSIEFNNWFDKCISTKDRVLLQMDVEGSELCTLEHLSPQNLSKIKLLVLEIHGFHFTSKANYLGEFHRNFILWLEKEFCLVASSANWKAGKTKVAGVWLPHAVESTWIRI